MSLAVVLLCALLMGLAACGGGSDEEQVRSAVQEFSKAFAEGDGDKACDLMTGEAKRQLATAGILTGGGDCAQIVEQVKTFFGKDDLERLRNIEVSNIRVRGDTATARTNADIGEGDGPMRLKKVDGEWLVDADPDEESSTTTSESGEASSEEPPPTVRAAEQGFTQKSETVSVGAVLRNEGTTGAGGVEVTMNILDSGGDVLTTETASVTAIPAGEEFNVGAEISLEQGGRADKVEITVDTSESVADAELPEVTNARVSRDEFGGMTVRAQIENTLDVAVSSVADVFAVVRDADGDIIGGLQGFPDSDIRPGRTVAVELSSAETLGKAEAVDVSVDAETTE